jgi:hypothetical protein
VILDHKQVMYRTRAAAEEGKEPEGKEPTWTGVTEGESLLGAIQFDRPGAVFPVSNDAYWVMQRTRGRERGSTRASRSSSGSYERGRGESPLRTSDIPPKPAIHDYCGPLHVCSSPQEEPRAGRVPAGAPPAAYTPLLRSLTMLRGPSGCTGEGRVGQGREPKGGEPEGARGAGLCALGFPCALVWMCGW